MNWFVELPNDTKVAIGSIVLTVLSLAVAYISSVVPWLGEFLKKYKEEWALAVTAALIQWLQNLLPGGAYTDISTLSVQLVVAIVLVLLAKLALAKLKVKGFRN